MRIILLRLAWVVVLVVSLTVIGSTNASCARPPNVYVINPVVTPDGSGGFFVAYQVNDNQRGPVTYVQRLGRQGESLWGPQGIRLDMSQPTKPLSPTQLVDDGKGNGIVVWGMEQKLNIWETLAGIVDPYGRFLWKGKEKSNIWAQKLDGEGRFVWKNKVGVGRSHGFYKLKAIGTDTGEVIVGWHDYQRGTVFFQKIDGHGTLLWPAEPRLSTNPAKFDMTTDSPGNTLLIWTSYDNGIWVQKINSSGEFAWSSPIVLLEPGTVPYTKIQDGIHSIWIVDDGSEGLVAGWIDYADGPHPLNLYKIDAKGKILWTRSELLAEGTIQARIAGDGSGGVFIVWRYIGPSDPTKGTGLLVRRIDSQGRTVLGKPGDPVVSSSVYDYDVQPDGSRGAVVVWRSSTGVIFQAQRVDAAGKKLWGNDALAISRKVRISMNLLPSIIPDGSGGFLVSYGEAVDVGITSGGRAIIVSGSFVHRIGPGGEHLWGPEGVRLDDWPRNR